MCHPLPTAAPLTVTGCERFPEAGITQACLTVHAQVTCYAVHNAHRLQNLAQEAPDLGRIGFILVQLKCMHAFQQNRVTNIKGIFSCDGTLPINLSIV